MRESVWKGLMTGMAGGLVAWWAVDRFYRLARTSASREAFGPYCVGAAIGVAYGVFVAHRSALTRVPLGAAVYLADPDATAAPAGNFAAKLASHGLKKAAELALG